MEYGDTNTTFEEVQVLSVVKKGEKNEENEFSHNNFSQIRIYYTPVVHVVRFYAIVQFCGFYCTPTIFPSRK